jgi:hypothetical protein
VPFLSQRFAGDTILEKCLNNQHIMQAGDPNTASVTTLQTALSDLGYRPMPIDGQFGDTTGGAVSQFKTDEGLSPTTPKVGPGTMQALDAYFAWEPSTPDLPDPSSAGLAQLVADVTTDHVLPWMDAAAGMLAQFPTDDPFPANPTWVVFDAALERNFHASLLPLGRAHAIRLLFAPIYDAARRALADGFITVVAKDRAAWDADGPGPYRPAGGTAGARFVVTPGFRNVLDATDQAVLISREAFNLAFDGLDTYGFPGTPRYANNGALAARNTVAYIAFGFELATGLPASFHPRPIWP